MSEKRINISDMPWFKFFGCKYSAFISLASRESAGDVLKAVCAYVCDMPVEELSDPLAAALFQSIKKDIDDEKNRRV